MKNKNILIISILVFVAVFYSGGTGFIGSKFNQKESLVTIRVTDPRAVGGALFHIALEKGYFTEQGVNVEVVGVQTGDEAIRALLSNSADVALGGIIPYSFLALDNQSVKIFAVNAYVHDNQIITDKSKGVTDAEGLRGKKIGYTKTTASDIGLAQFLETHALKPTDIQLVNMKPLAMAGALQSGQIDAYSSWEPHILNGQKLLGDHALVFSADKDTYTWHQSLMATDSYIGAHKESLVKFVKALQEAERFTKTNTVEAIALASKHDSVPADILAKIWARYDLSISLNNDIYGIIKTDLEWANSQRERPVATIPPAESLVDVSVLHEANK